MALAKPNARTIDEKSTAVFHPIVRCICEAANMPKTPPIAPPVSAEGGEGNADGFGEEHR